MRKLFLLSLATLFFSCSQPTSPQQKVTNPEGSDTNTRPPLTETTQSTTPSVPQPEIKAFAVVSIWRASDKPDQRGTGITPRLEVRTENIRFDKEPAVGEKVTVIPLGVNLAPLELKVIKTKKAQDECDDKKTKDQWDVELEAIDRKEFFDAAPISNRSTEFPFDVCIVYPSVGFARAVEKGGITNAMLPKDVSINTITAAIDLTNDLQPDLLFIKYCCDDVTKPADDPVNDCYQCGKAFKRSQDAWSLVDSSAPC